MQHKPKKIVHKFEIESTCEIFAYFLNTFDVNLFITKNL